MTASPRPGDGFETATIEVTETLRAEVVRIGGYVHPLFTTPDEVSLPEGVPLPGQAVLLLMGGLVEQSHRLDDAIALLGLREVRFRRPAVRGGQVRVRVDVLDEEPRSGGRAVLTMRWSAQDRDGATLVEATVLMLVNRA